MPISFNTVLRQYGIDPADVRLLRHQDTRPQTLKTPYGLWNESVSDFDLYQSVQSFKNRSRLEAPTWAAFVADPSGNSLFVGLYATQYNGVGQIDLQRPHELAIDLANSYDKYDLQLKAEMSDLIGLLKIEWGAATRAWIQRAERQDKAIIELREKFQESPFPGFANFIGSLSEISNLPVKWIEPLRSTRGIYLLTCPKTKEQYVGAALGVGGFWARWNDYVASGHGNNVALKSRDPSDYRVSILETVGNLATSADILMLEQNWKLKLQSREMGLNRN